MVTIQVFIPVKPEVVETFREANLQNGRQTVHEPGNLRFDFYQDIEDLTRFTLIEIYELPEVQQAHLNSEYFKTWRDATMSMITERSRASYTVLFPEVSPK